MRKALVTVYDLDMRRVAHLDNATTIGYEQPMNGLWKARFTLPANDPKNAECVPMRYIELYDEKERLELFRIMPTTAKRSSNGETITYECEHVLATLLDDVLFQFHTIGGLGIYTTDVLNYLLSKQTVTRWQLGTVSFNRQFEYNWENEKLLNALRSVPGPFTEEYLWTWDTTVYPWKLNLVEPPDHVDAYIRYGVNMKGIERHIDPRGLCTRLYGLGYGEGVNQLNFAEINGGKPYIDADTQAQFGIIEDVFVDRRFEYPETLKARTEAILNERKIPRISYRVDAADPSQVSDVPLYKFASGGKVRVIDTDLDIDIIARVTNKIKPDLRGQPGDVQLEISNKPVDIAGLFNELETKQRINDLYAQGATNFDSHDFADNCDPNNPAVLRFFIPQETAKINRVTLSYQSEAFRAYSRAIEAAPATTSGPSSRETTASGGQTTSGPSSTSTTASGGQTTSGPSSRETTSSGGQTTSGASSTDTTGNANVRGDTEAGTVYYYPIKNEYGKMGEAGEHNHGIPPGTQLLTPDGTVTWVQSGNHEHPIGYHYHDFWSDPHTHGMDHTHQIAAHTHGMDHTHQIAAHTHGMDHTHQIAAHTHGMDHTHTIPAHTHGIEYGIFRGPTPTTITVRVDGTPITGLGTSVTDVDIVPFLRKDGGGKIQRGWHEVSVTPNSLGRIVASINTQIFVQSRGGGNY